MIMPGQTHFKGGGGEVDIQEATPNAKVTETRVTSVAHPGTWNARETPDVINHGSPAGDADAAGRVRTYYLPLYFAINPYCCRFSKNMVFLEADDVEW